MKRFTGTQAVKGGYYFNIRNWKLEAVDGTFGTLPGTDTDRYLRVPLVALLFVAPVLGLFFVVLLPFFGLAVLGEGLWRRMRAVMATRGAGRVRPTTVRR